jgi:hypothetical protein
MGRLIDMGLSIDVRTNDDETPLMIEACYGKKGALELLLCRGAAINCALYLWFSQMPTSYTTNIAQPSATATMEPVPDR